MKRKIFINEFWLPYPKGDANWLDVHDFLSHSAPSHHSFNDRSGVDSGYAIVAGRLRFDEANSQNVFLNSGGSEIPLSFIREGADKTTWLRPLRSESVTFDREVLISGDLVAVEIARNNSNQFLIRRILLLAPAQLAYEKLSYSFEVSRLWAKYLGHIRQFFAEREFLELTTPTLVPSPGTEPFLDPFSTFWEFGSEKRRFYLPTSPEFHLKKYLANGWTKIFELKTCFRNGELSENHQPEFLMLEWYRAYRDLNTIADDVEELLRFLTKAFGLEPVNLERKTVAGLFAETFSGFELKPTTSIGELHALAETIGVSYREDDQWDDVFFRIFIEKIESELGTRGPLLVQGYPPSQAALSRIGESGFAERFEVYWRGLELANAFHELNDPFENILRFEEDNKKKTAIGKQAVPIDEELVRYLMSGLPPTGGIALGVDRLFMALFGIASIAETRAFPVTPHLIPRRH